MKKLVKLLLCLTLVLALTGCGKEQTATYELETVQGTLSCVDTQILKAKGDVVYQMDTNSYIDLSALSEEEKTAIVEFYSAYFGEMKDKAPSTVKIEFSSDDKAFKSSCSMDIKNSDLQELIDLGFVAMTSDTTQKVTFISFKQSCEGLEALGFKLVEE